MLQELHADKVHAQGARSSVVNGPFTGSKERRSFKPEVASSILVGRIGGDSGECRVLPMPEPIARPTSRSAFRALPGDSEAFREVVVTFWSHFSSALRLVGELREVGHRDFERPGDPLHGGPRGVAFAALDQGKHVLGDAGVLGQRLKAVAALVAQLADRGPKSLLRFWILGSSGRHNRFGRLC